MNATKAKLNLQKWAKKIRSEAADVESNKENIADSILGGIKGGIDQFEEYVVITRSVADAASALHKIGTAIVKDEGVRAKAKSLLSNVVSDCVKRVNEFTGIVDYISKSETISGDVEDFCNSMSDIRKRVKEFEKSRNKSRKKRGVDDGVDFHESQEFQDICDACVQMVIDRPDSIYQAYRDGKELMDKYACENPDINVDWQQCTDILMKLLEEAQDKAKKR